jgi:FkbM family methyltransferase
MVNGLLNIYPQHSALSFKPGEVHMSASVADGQSRGLNMTEAEEQGREINYGGMNLGKGGEKVVARTLDWYNLTAVSLIKVDVQGAEKLVFYGARETIRRNLPAVVYEDTDFAISADMNATMHIPPEVHEFNITGEGEGTALIHLIEHAMKGYLRRS